MSRAKQLAEQTLASWHGMNADLLTQHEAAQIILKTINDGVSNEVNPKQSLDEDEDEDDDSTIGFESDDQEEEDYDEGYF